MTNLKTLIGATAIVALSSVPAVAGHHSDMEAEAKIGDTMGVTADFATFDADNDGSVTFTEFSDYLSTYGYSDADVAAEFTRLSGSTGMITDADFAGFDVEKLNHTKLGGQWHDGHMKTAQADMTDSVTLQSSMGGDFAAYDSNRDGRVDFNEYSKMAKKDGLTMTAAAQRFTKMTQGQPYLDEGTFLSAMSTDPSYYDTTIYRSTVSSTPRTMVLDSSTMAPADPLNPSNPVDVYDDFEPTGTYTDPMKATVDPMYRPSDKVGGDLRQTANPQMDVRPGTVDSDVRYSDIRDADDR